MRSGVRCAETMCFSQPIAERGQGFGGMAHGVPVRLASHDDGDRGGHAVNSFRESKNIGRIIGSTRGSARRWQGVWNGLSCLGESRQASWQVPHEEENEGGGRADGKTPQRRPRRGQSRDAAREAARSLRPPRSRPAAATDPARPAIRRLRAQLAQAQARIKELEARRGHRLSAGVFPTGAALSASSIARSPISSAIKASGALIVLDVDRLKPINDAFGHAAGDRC